MRWVWRQLNIVHKTTILGCSLCLILFYFNGTLRFSSYEHRIAGTWSCEEFTDGFASTERISSTTLRTTIGGEYFSCKEKGKVKEIQVRNGSITILSANGAERTGSYQLQPYEGVESWECEIPCNNQTVLVTQLEIPDLPTIHSETGYKHYVLELSPTWLGYSEMTIGSYEAYNGRDRIRMSRVSEWKRNTTARLSALADYIVKFGYYLRPPEARIVGIWNFYAGTSGITRIQFTREDITVQYSDGTVATGVYRLDPSWHTTPCRCDWALVTNVILGAELNPQHHSGEHELGLYLLQNFERNMMGIHSHVPLGEGVGFSLQRQR
ncbi:MAG: hypothetical protein AAF702_28110 [Chloroflexota bacterium]